MARSIDSISESRTPKKVLICRRIKKKTSSTTKTKQMNEQTMLLSHNKWFGKHFGYLSVLGALFFSSSLWPHKFGHLLSLFAVAHKTTDTSTTAFNLSFRKREFVEWKFPVALSFSWSNAQIRKKQRKGKTSCIIWPHYLPVINLLTREQIIKQFYLKTKLYFSALFSYFHFSVDSLVCVFPALKFLWQTTAAIFIIVDSISLVVYISPFSYFSSASLSLVLVCRGEKLAHNFLAFRDIQPYVFLVYRITWFAHAHSDTYKWC